MSYPASGLSKISRMAFLGGADYIVVGRPTGTAPNPGAAEDFQKRIADLFAGKPATA